jgi:predicted enzyme related to lactoylglutathione lyase
MADPTYAPIGQFCWTELATSDMAASKAFFANLLGWAAEDMPAAMGSYTIFRLGGLDVGGGYGNNPEQGPPHFTCYVQVADAAETAAKAKGLGATVIMDAFDVEGIGRMAVIQDPTGAVFAVWQSGSHHGAGVFNVPGALCWTELMTRDLDAAEAFYAGLFGWSLKRGTGGGMTYTEACLEGGQPFAGLFKPDWPGAEHIPPHWNPYFTVEDVDASAAKAKVLGATILAEPMDIEKVGRFAAIQEPGGAAFSIFKLAHPM